MWEQIRYRAKAIVAAIGLLVVGTAEYVVAAPDTGRLVAQLLPAPWGQIGTVLLGVVYAGLVHAVPNAPKPGEAGALSEAQAEAVKALVQSHLKHLGALQGTSVAKVTTATGLVQLSTTPGPQPRLGVGGN